MKDWVQASSNPNGGTIVRYYPRTGDSTAAVKGCFSVIIFIIVFVISYVLIAVFILNNNVGISGIYIWLISLVFSALVSRRLVTLLGQVAKVFSRSAKDAKLEISKDCLDVGSKRIEFRKILRFQLSHKIDEESGILYAVNISGEKIPVTTEVTQSQGQEILRIILQCANASGYSIDS